MLQVLLGSEDLIKRSMNARVAFELLLCQLVRSVDQNPVQKKETHHGDFKEELVKILQVESPKLAAIVHNSSIKRDGKLITIAAANDFAQKQLMHSKNVLEKIFKDLLQVDCTLQVQIADEVKKDNNLEDTIRVLFDGEEVK
jgi:choline kinase